MVFILLMHLIWFYQAASQSYKKSIEMVIFPHPLHSWLHCRSERRTWGEKVSDECEGGKETQAQRGGRGWSGWRSRGGVRNEGGWTHVWVVTDDWPMTDRVAGKYKGSGGEKTEEVDKQPEWGRWRGRGGGHGWEGGKEGVEWSTVFISVQNVLCCRFVCKCHLLYLR